MKDDERRPTLRELYERARKLVEGVDVDLNAPLEDDEDDDERD